MPVARPALGEHFAGGYIERGDQRGGAMADVVVGDVLHVSQVDGQHPLRPVQSLDLRLLVDADHHRLFWWVQVETDDVADLLNKERVVGEI